MLSEQALSKREDALDKASTTLNDARKSVNEARSSVDKADSAVYAAAEDIRNAKTDEERAEARQRELNAMQQRDKAERRYEKAEQQYEEAKKDAQDLFAKQREQAIAFRDCIPSESTSQHARALASMIKKGEDEFQSLEYQREALQLPGLEKPLPYICNADMKMAAGMLFVQRVGPSIG